MVVCMMEVHYTCVFVPVHIYDYFVVTLMSCRHFKFDVDTANSLGIGFYVKGRKNTNSLKAS